MKSRATPFLAAVLLLLAPLAGLAYLGTFTRLHADDFCIGGAMLHLGLWPGLVQWYTHWTGRFMYLFSALLIAPTGPTGGAIFPALVIAAWFLILTWAALPLLKRSGWPHPRLLAAAAAGLVLQVLLSSIPDIFQSIFWRDGQVNYSFPMLAFSLLAGLLLRVWLVPDQKARPLNVAAALILAFWAGGFAEAFDAMQAGALALIFGLTWLLGSPATRRRLLPVIGAALLGSLVAMGLMITAPGNQVRRDLLGEGAGLVRIVTFSLRNAAVILGKFFLWNPGWALLAILVPAAAGAWLEPAGTPLKPAAGQPWWRLLWAQTWLRGLLLTPVCAFLLAVAACAPVVFILNAYPNERTILIPQTALVVGIIVSSGLLGVGLRRLGWLPDWPALRRALPVAILAGLVLAAGLSLGQTAAQVPDLQAYAARWDQRHAVLLEARRLGQAEVTVYGLENRSGIGDLRAEPDYWINACMAEYYELPILRGK